jgi:putative ATPase
MAELFESAAKEQMVKAQPLAVRMRPRTLDEIVGQQHILGEGKLLRRAIQADRISSIILFGPPGTGKTTLAEVIANATKSRFERLSGVESNVADMRRVVAAAKNRLESSGQRTILFIDEIHRFNKAQQDVLLPDVENGTVRLIGATTHNPFFYVNAPLVSRSQVFELKPLSIEEIKSLLRRALADKERGLGNYTVEISEEALTHLAKLSDGDARKALSALEIGVLTTPPIIIGSAKVSDVAVTSSEGLSRDQSGDLRSSNVRGQRPSHNKPVMTRAGTAVPPSEGKIIFDLRVAEESIQRKAVVYDADEDGHYDTISAFIKSMRGSDPDAALYWLAKMVVAGEDPRFIARRIVICAAEDVGMADPMALLVATAAHQAVEFIGWPEGELPLAEATVYIATAPKSNASAKGIWSAKADVESGRTLAVPDALQDAHYQGAQRLGHGKGYKYAHDYEGGVVAQEHLPEKKKYYEPTEHGFEKKVRERMAQWKRVMEGGGRKPEA